MTDDDRKVLDALKLTGFYAWGLEGLLDSQYTFLNVAQHVEESRVMGAAVLMERYSPAQIRAILDATYGDSCSATAPNHQVFRERVLRGEFTIPQDA